MLFKFEASLDRLADWLSGSAPSAARASRTGRLVHATDAGSREPHRIISIATAGVILVAGHRRRDTALDAIALWGEAGSPTWIE